MVPFPQSHSYLALVRVEYSDADPEFYTLPFSVAAGEPVSEFILAKLRAGDGATGMIYSALRNRAFADELLTAILKRRRFAGDAGELAASHTRHFRAIWGRTVRRSSHPWRRPTRTIRRCSLGTGSL